MDWDKAHQGESPQQMTDPERERLARGGGSLGVNPDLHAPEISNPADEAEVNLHGDIEGSPYSATPGEMSLEEADQQERTETLATRDEDAGSDPNPPPSGSKAKK